MSFEKVPRDPRTGGIVRPPTGGFIGSGKGGGGTPTSTRAAQQAGLERQGYSREEIANVMFNKDLYQAMQKVGKNAKVIPQEGGGYLVTNA